MSHPPRRRTAAALVAAALAVAAAGCGSDNNTSTSTTKASSDSGKGGKIALLLPENKTARYEAQDKPRFIASVKELCPGLRGHLRERQPGRRQAAAAGRGGASPAARRSWSSTPSTSPRPGHRHARQAGQHPGLSYGRLVSNAAAGLLRVDRPLQGRPAAGARSCSTRSRSRARRNAADRDDQRLAHGLQRAAVQEGRQAIFDQAGAKIVKSYDTPDWSPDKAQQEMEQAITALGKNGFDAVYVANDGMAGGAIAAMKARGHRPEQGPRSPARTPRLTGVQRILAGEQLMTVYQPIKKIAATSADLAVPLAQGKQPPADHHGQDRQRQRQVPSVLLPTIAITKDNINDTVVKDGFLKPSDICTGQYAKACKAAGIG